MSLVSTAVRATHLVTNAAWFGGSLMGAVGLNPAARRPDTQRERVEVSGTGWERWGPVEGASIGLHLSDEDGHPADPEAADRARRKLAWLQWTTPALTGSLLVLDAQLGEQQRGAAGLLDRPW